MSRNKFKIRQMKKADLTEVALLYKDVYDKVDIGENWDESSAYELMSYWFTKQPDMCFVATVDDVIVGGFVAGIKPWWDGNHLVDGELFVDFNYQRQKIGNHLLQACIDKALEKYKITNLDAVTFSKNGFPLSLYKKMGFKIERSLILINADPETVLKNLRK